jgi:hypothetical protein
MQNEGSRWNAGKDLSFVAPRPEAMDGNTCFFSSSEPRSIRPMVPSLLTAGISDADASTRATSSMMMHAAMHRVEVRSDERLQGFFREARILVDVGRMRRDLLLRQRTNRRPQLLMLLG